MPHARHPTFLLGSLGAASLLNGFIIVGLHLGGINPTLEGVSILLEAALLPALAFFAYKATRACFECGQSTEEYRGLNLKRREFLSMGIKLLIVATLTQLGLGGIARAVAARGVAGAKKLEILDSRKLDRNLALDLAEKFVEKDFVKSLLGETGLRGGILRDGVSASEHIVTVDGEPAMLTAVGIPVDEEHVILVRRFEFNIGEVKKDAFSGRSVTTSSPSKPSPQTEGASISSAIAAYTAATTLTAP